MGRKFHLSVYRKNEERKKQAIPIQRDSIRPGIQRAIKPLKVAIQRDVVSIMTVAIPVHNYYMAKVSSITALRDRIEATGLLPSGTYMCVKIIDIDFYSYLYIIIFCKIGKIYRLV